MPRRPSPGRPAGQYTQAVRLFRLQQLLEASPEGMRLEDVAQELGVTARSIRRDLKALEVAQTEIEHVDTEGERRVRIKRTPRTQDTIKLTRFQRFSLSAVRQMIDVLIGTPFHDDLSQVLSKITLPLGDDHGSSLVERFLYIPDAPKDYRKQKDHLYEIYDGLLQSRTVQFLYDGGSTPGMRKVEPYALVLYKNGLYLVGRDAQKKEERTFAVERMKRVKALSNMPFIRNPNFDVAQKFEGAFGIIAGDGTHHVVIDFTGWAVRYAQERTWHHSQTLTETEHGARLEFDVSNLKEVLRWVLGWGGAAVVREPPELVALVKEDLLAATQAYASAALDEPANALR